MKGGILVAMAQGTLGGIAFWFLGIHAALLWAVLMAFLSLIPAIGATLVWLPVAIYFLATGAIWQGIGLILYGVLVIGLVDNLLRPFLVGKGSKLPDYVVLISTLGGIEVFGLNGFVVGPLIAAMFMVSWEIFAVSRRASGDDAAANANPSGWVERKRNSPSGHLNNLRLAPSYKDGDGRWIKWRSAASWSARSNKQTVSRPGSTTRRPISGSGTSSRN